MKAWVVKDYKEVHMSNSLIALAHSKPDYECLCTEVNILTDQELQERDERIARHWYEMGVNNGHGSNTFEEFFEDYKKSKREK